ncbi:hypothetical protein B0H63DRAFT_488503 [Podospora didyma]|uniref:SnoaL-like domain-containing protein n=1 Tax=Podospora didyma TaxID=330526 RepID=A0AAE0K313_9PEZI|nr:hypothetical protein B0H63DRAFT_488503 [Podospora didyma]
MWTPSFVLLSTTIINLLTMTQPVSSTPVVNAAVSADVSASTLSRLPAVSPEIAQIIQTKKLQYARFADTHQWEKFNQVALPECTYSYTDHGKIIVDHGFTYRWSSTKDFTTFFSAAFQTLQTMHHIGPGEFNYTDSSLSEVLAIFPVVYYSALAQGATDTQGVTGTGGGHYYETYRRKGTDWLMSKCTMDRIYNMPANSA